MAELGFEPSESGFRAHASIHHSTVRARLPSGPSPTPTHCFVIKENCVTNSEDICYSESFGTYLIPKLTAAHIYL